MLETGSLIDDRYKIIKVLGEGGMAVVYLAKDVISNKDVAVKIIKEETMKNPVNLTRFEREACLIKSSKYCQSNKSWCP